MATTNNIKTNLIQLQTLFDEFFINNSDNLPALSQFLQKYCHLDNIKNIIQNDILSSEKNLQYIAERSYFHGNGFLKIVLLDNFYKIRLHIWFEGISAEENIHSHRWDFASHILAGTLHSEIWQETQNMDDQVHHLDCYLYTAKTGFSPPKSKYIGKKYLIKLRDDQFYAGNTYFMYKNNLHRIKANYSSFIATIICTLPTQTTDNLLFPNIKNPNIEPRYINKHELKNYLEKFISKTN